MRTQMASCSCTSGTMYADWLCVQASVTDEPFTAHANKQASKPAKVSALVGKQSCSQQPR